MNRSINFIKLIFLALALLLCLAVPIIGLVSTTVNWEGICYGPTNNARECSWWQFAWDEMFWTLMFFIPFVFITALAWIGMALFQFVAHQWEKRKR